MKEENLKASEVLVEALRRLMERGWCKGDYEDSDGHLCALGGLWSTNDDVTGVAEHYLEAALPGGVANWSNSTKRPIAVYNDHPFTTFNDVHSLFTDGIALAKEAGD